MQLVVADCVVSRGVGLSVEWRCISCTSQTAAAAALNAAHDTACSRCSPPEISGAMEMLVHAARRR